MPEEMEKDLKAKAKKKGLTGEHADAYIYGNMRKTGWKPKREKHHSAPNGSFYDERAKKFGVS